jgi:hypothetical protein
MSDEEYREWLSALAREYLQPTELAKSDERLRHAVERLSSTPRFADAVRDRNYRHRRRHHGGSLIPT